MKLRNPRILIQWSQGDDQGDVDCFSVGLYADNHEEIIDYHFADDDHTAHAERACLPLIDLLCSEYKIDRDKLRIEWDV